MHIGSRIGWIMQQSDEPALARLRPAQLPMAWAAPDAHRPLEVLGLELEQATPDWRNSASTYSRRSGT
jgi:hypothetical protein